jgi:hypothetical protein
MRPAKKLKEDDQVMPDDAPPGKTFRISYSKNFDESWRISKENIERCYPSSIVESVPIG